MKKMALAVAAVSLIIGGSALAQDGTVYSVNVVGFQKVQTATNSPALRRFALVSNPFNAATNDINIVVGDQMDGFVVNTIADKVHTFNGTSYDSYWKNNGDGLWRSTDFINNAGPVAEQDLPPGTGFWVEDAQANSDVEVVMVGEVVDVPAVTNVINEGFTLIGYPYSSDLDLSTSALTNGFGAAASGLADKIYRFSEPNQSYTEYWLKNFSTFPVGWVKTSDGTGPTAPLTTDVIPTGEGFWYLRTMGQGDFTWVETIPYDLDAP